VSLLTFAIVGVAIAAGLVLGPVFSWQTACVTLVIDEYPLGVLEPVPFAQEDRDALRTSLAGRLHTPLGSEPVDLVDFDSAQGVRDLLLPRMRGLDLRGKDVLLAYIRGQAFVAPPVFDSGGLERANPLSGVPCLLASDCRISGERPQEIVPVRTVIEAVAASPARTTLVAVDFGDLQWDPRLGVLGHVVPAALDQELAKPQTDLRSQTWVIGSHDLFQMSSASVQARRSCFGRAFELALAGEADMPPIGNENGLVELDELARFVSVWTNEWTRRLSGGRSRQTPVVWKLGTGRVPIAEVPAGIGLLRVSPRSQPVEPTAEKPSDASAEPQSQESPAEQTPPAAAAVADAKVRPAVAADEPGAATLAFPAEEAEKPAGESSEMGGEAASRRDENGAEQTAEKVPAASDGAEKEVKEQPGGDEPPAAEDTGTKGAAPPETPSAAAEKERPPEAPQTPQVLPPPAPPKDAWEALALLGKRRLEPAVAGGPPAILSVPGDYGAAWWRNCYAVAASAASRATSTGPMGERANATLSLLGSVLGRMASSPLDAAPPSGESPAAEQLWAAREAADSGGYFQRWSAAPDAFCRVVAIRNESLATLVSAIDIVGRASGGAGTPPLDPAALIGLASKLRDVGDMLAAGADSTGIDRLTSAARGMNSQRAAIADQLERFVEGLHRGGPSDWSPVVSRSLAVVRSPMITDSGRALILRQVFSRPEAVPATSLLEATGRPTGIPPQPEQIQLGAIENIAALTECLPAMVEAAGAGENELLENEIVAVRREIVSLSNVSREIDAAIPQVIRLGGRVARLLAGVAAEAVAASQDRGPRSILDDRDAGLLRAMDLRDIPQLEAAVVVGLPDWSAEDSYGLSLELTNSEGIAVGRPSDLRLAVDSGGVLPAGTEVRFLFDPASLELRLPNGSRVAADIPVPTEALGIDGGEVLLTVVANRHATTPGERVLLEVIWDSAQQASSARLMLPLPANRSIAVGLREGTEGGWQWGHDLADVSGGLQRGEVALQMVPGALTAWQLAVVNEAEIPRDVSVSIYSISTSTAEGAGPSLGRDVLWQRWAEQLARGESLGRPVMEIEKLPLPVGEAAVALVFPPDKPPAEPAPPKPADPPPASPVFIGPDLALVIREQTKGEPARAWLYRLRCELLHPRGLLDAFAVWREADQTIELTFTLNEIWKEQLRLPPEGLTIEMEPLTTEPARPLQIRRGQTVLTADRRRDTLMASWNGTTSDLPARVAIHINGYPRAFVFTVACEPGQDGEPQQPQSDWRMLRIVEPAQEQFIVTTAASKLPIMLQVDAPPDAGLLGSGQQPLIASLGLREVQAGTFFKQPQRLVWMSESDRAVTYAMEEAKPPVSLAIRTRADDWQLELPSDGFVDVDVEAEAKLILPGSQPPLTTARRFVFDGRPPVVDAPPLVNAVVGPQLVIPVEAVDDPRDRFAGSAGRHLPGVSGVDKVEWAIDLKGDGKPEAWQPAVSVGASRYEIRLETKSLPVGTRLPLLVRATDRSGLSAPPTRVWVVTAVEVAKGRIEGRVLLNGRGEANVPVTITGPGKLPSVKSGKDGAFVIPDLNAGEYELKAEGVVRNVTYTSKAQTVKVELPPAPLTSVILELE